MFRKTPVNFRPEIAVSVLSAISVLVILIDYSYALDDFQKNTVYVFDTGVVAVLAADFYKRYKKSKEGARFILKHWYEIPAMLPVFMFVFIESQFLVGAAVRSFRLIRVFRIVHVFFRTTAIFEGSRLVEIFMITGGIIVVGAIAGFLVESNDPDSKMANIGDAFWWAIVTVTTVGYGDIVPVTVEGKIVGALLMITGMGTLAVVTSRLGAALIEARTKKHQVYRPVNEEAKSLVKNKVDEIERMDEQELNTLVAMIKALWETGRKKPDAE
ncbi:MAG TPA: ion channel [Nitrososphaera sp.]|jgi:voltage-gated potassium channel|nr:ion channel [Nitrososphaera sp.]